MWEHMNHQPYPVIYVHYRPFFGSPMLQPQEYNPFPPMQPVFPQFHQTIPQNAQQIIVIQSKQQPIKDKAKKIADVNKDEVRQFYYANNRSLRKTREKFGIGYGRIQNIINNTTIRHYQVTSPEEDHFIMTSAMSGFLTSQDIVRMLLTTFGHKISHDTVTRRLHKFGFSFLKPRIVQQLTEDQKTVRFNFAIRMLDSSQSIFPYIIFSDESRFSNSPDSFFAWRKPNDFSEKCAVKKAKKPLSIMVWGAIGYNLKSTLYIHHGAVRGQEYKTCLDESKIFLQADEQFGRGGYVFQQDGATCHMREDIISYITKKARILNGWPPNSPDLSPIEMIWAHLKYKQSYLPPANNKEELISQIQQLWNEIPQESINKLVLSFKYRLEMCRDVGGKTISHFLSAKKHSVPPECKELDPPLITDEDYIRIFELSREYKRKWKKISSIFYSEKQKVISPLIIRHKVLEMEHRIKDYELFHDYYDTCPEDIAKFVNEENLEYNFILHPIDDDQMDENGNGNDEQRAAINIPHGNSENFPLEVPEYSHENEDSEWEVSTDEED